MEDAKFLVVIPPGTSGVVPMAPMLPDVDLGSESLKEAGDRVVQIVTQAQEGRASTVVPLGTGSLIKQEIIVNARHTVVDSDGLYIDAFVDGQKVEFLIASPIADLALLRLPEAKTVSPFDLATFSKLNVRKPIAVLGYPLEGEMNTDSKLMLRQSRIVDIDDTAHGALCTKFEDKDTLWAASEEDFNEAEAQSIHDSCKARYAGEHAIIVPAHHIRTLLEEADLASIDPLSIPGLWAKKH
ncbi:g6281 [Coccomyxa elongata]